MLLCPKVPSITVAASLPRERTSIWCAGWTLFTMMSYARRCKGSSRRSRTTKGERIDYYYLL